MSQTLIFAGMEWASATNGSLDFPAVTRDETGNIWLASLAYCDGRRSVRVHRLFNESEPAARELVVSDATGMGPPSICAYGDGCVVACAVEQDDRWRIACFFPESTMPVFLDCGGTVNCTPAIAAVGSQVQVVWQSNADGGRAIYSAAVTPDGCDDPVGLSDAEANSQNPAIVALSETEAFVAWDSMRGGSIDIFGARLSDGVWGQEQRLTSDARIERHPSLTADNGSVWMAWQAQSYPGRRINRVEEQRIVTARVDSDGLHAVPGWFEDVSPADRLYVRPTVAFDAGGRLWLSARRSRGPQDGWNPEIRVYDGESWSPVKVPTRHTGRWRPVPLLPLEDCVLWAAQCDDLPVTWNQQGIWPDWRSWVEVAALRPYGGGEPKSIAAEALKMPETEFELSDKRALCAADLPEQRADVGGKELTLLWGDCHDHTDLSVCDRAKNPPGPDLFANERDIEGLDFCALTDHGYNMDPAQWAYNGEQTRKYHDPDRFVTFLGEEWTSEVAPPLPDGKSNRYGHHNLVFLDPYHSHYYDAHDGDISPADLWNEVGDAEMICIPHQLACWEGKGAHNVPVVWDYTDDRIQPVAEICQTRASYEGLGCPYQSKGATPWKGHFLQDAWERGIIIGVIASPDHGGGKGKAGVWAESRTREAIFAAIRARHTFGTSGAKMSLLVRCGDGIIGDILPLDTGPVLQVDAACVRPVRQLSILRNNEVVFETAPDETEVHVSWEDTDRPDADRFWYYVRMSTGDDEWAWSSPIWFIKE